MTDMTTADRRTRVLFISYAFPPVGGAGVQRVTKFIKYLADTGWDASVLTVANPSVPVMDHSLIAELPPQTHIVRARTFEPSYAAKHAISSGHAALTRGKAMLRKLAAGVLQPDPQVLWMPAAWRAATHLLRRTQHDAIIASGPPFSSFLLGAALSRRSGLPLILDYRDEWDLTNQYWKTSSSARCRCGCSAQCSGTRSGAPRRWSRRRAAARRPSRQFVMRRAAARA